MVQNFTSLLVCFRERVSHPGSLGQRKELHLGESFSRSVAKIVPSFILEIKFTFKNTASPF